MYKPYPHPHHSPTLILTTPPTGSCKAVDERNKATQLVVNHDDSSNLVNFHGPTAKIMPWVLIALIAHPSQLFRLQHLTGGRVAVTTASTEG